MQKEEFEKVLNEQIEQCLKVLDIKKDEYATDDRLHNFKTAAKLKHETPAQSLAGMMVKHTVSIYDMLAETDNYPMSVWNEKITDNINYLLLLKALILEGRSIQTISNCATTSSVCKSQRTEI